MPSNTVDIHENFANAKSYDDLWNMYFDEVQKFGFTSISYGYGYSRLVAKEEGVFAALSWYQDNHPKWYEGEFGKEYYINNDLGSIHCLNNNTPFIWHDESQWLGTTPEQIELMHKSKEFNMSIGVSVPCRFGYYGIGGLGLAAGNLDAKEFGRVWIEKQNQILAICNSFDTLARKSWKPDIVPLSPREVEVLTRLAIGENTKIIAYKFGTTESSVEKQARSVREKLSARSNSHAVVKALALELIQP